MLVLASASLQSSKGARALMHFQTRWKQGAWVAELHLLALPSQRQLAGAPTDQGEDNEQEDKG